SGRINTMSQLEIKAPAGGAQSEILTPDALDFVSKLVVKFEPQRQDLLERRKARQKDLDAGKFPDFLTETAGIREKEWTVAPIPRDLTDRRVEITGPVDRKMVIN